MWLNAFSQSSFKVFNKDNTRKPVSEFLYGGMWEISCGRSELLWGEILNDRGFESFKSFDDNGWLSITRGNLRMRTGGIRVIVSLNGICFQPLKVNSR